MDDLIRTLDSDTEDVPIEDTHQNKRKKGAKERLDETLEALNPDFTFDFTGDVYTETFAEHALLQDEIKIGSKPKPISVDDIIAKRKIISTQTSRKRKRESEDEDESSGDSDVFSSEESRSDSEDEDKPSGSSTDESEVGQDEKSNSSSDEEEEETAVEKERKAAFFASEKLYP